MNRIFPKWRIGAALLTGISTALLAQKPAPTLGSKGIKTVLLISIDGMHALDFVN